MQSHAFASRVNTCPPCEISYLIAGIPSNTANVMARLNDVYLLNHNEFPIVWSIYTHTGSVGTFLLGSSVPCSSNSLALCAKNNVTSDCKKDFVLDPNSKSDGNIYRNQKEKCFRLFHPQREALLTHQIPNNSHSCESKSEEFVSGYPQSSTPTERMVRDSGVSTSSEVDSAELNQRSH